MVESLTSFIPPIIYILSQAIILWAFSLYYKDSSLMDRFWGLSFVIISWMAQIEESRSTPQWVLLAMINIWGLRLSWHITKRNWSKGEDHRYLNIRKSTTSYQWKSFFMIFLLQGILILLISSPIYIFLNSPSVGNIYTLSIGLIIWLSGWLIEAIADKQLKLFIKQKSNSGDVLQRGLWSLCRHPNYFGECLLWWGIYIYCLSPNTWFLIFSPILVT